MTALTFVVAALACYRLTLLVSADRITQPQRLWVIEHAPKFIGRLVICPWCVSVWLAPFVVGSALAWSSGWGWWLAAGSLAASAVTGYLSTYALPE